MYLRITSRAGFGLMIAETGYEVRVDPVAIHEKKPTDRDGKSTALDIVDFQTDRVKLDILKSAVQAAPYFPTAGISFHSAASAARLSNADW